MDDKTTDCYVASNATGAKIKYAFNLYNYAGGSFNPADFLNMGQVAGILLMQEFDKCGYNNFLVVMDQALSKLPQLIGSISNGATQAAGNSGEAQTSLAKGFEKANKNFKYKDTDWEQFGQGYQLALSSLLKYEAPDVYQDVTFTS
jgi:hypothetical protein